MEPQLRHLLLLPYLLLYDTMNDDDEEIRDLGAALTSRLLCKARKTPSEISLVPLAAGRQLAEWLAERYPRSEALAWGAVHHLTGGTSADFRNLDQVRGLESVAEQLAEATKEDHSLFVVEKQNLFIDQVREAEVWSSVLTRLDLAKIASSQVACSRFMQWTLDGISVLIKLAHADYDGPLGWISKPDVFAIGVRVISATAVVSSWSWSLELKEQAMRCRSDLQLLATIGRTQGMHGSWLTRIETSLPIPITTATEVSSN